MIALRGDQVRLLIASIGLSVALFLLVPLALSRLPAFWAYHATLVLYWLGFCLPVALRFGGTDRQLLGLDLYGRAKAAVPLLIGFQCLAVLAGALLPVLSGLTLGVLMLAITVAVINAPLEEMAWRGAFIASFADRPVLGYVTSSALFALWHVPLALVAGVEYPGGPMALVGGAAGLGLFWGALAWWTRRIGWVAIAHTITNIFAFAGLNIVNAWP